MKQVPNRENINNVLYAKSFKKKADLIKKIKNPQWLSTISFLNYVSEASKMKKHKFF